MGIAILFLPTLLCMHIVKSRPHTKLGKWIGKHIISNVDLDPIKGKPLDDDLEPPLKNGHE